MTAPHHTGYDCTPFTGDYENVTEYRTGAGKVVDHSNRTCTYEKRAGRKEQPVLDRLWARTDLVDHPNFDTPCWLYDGIDKTHKYQQIWYHGKFVRIHRLSLVLLGDIELTSGMHVDHLCERKNCWNTAHLEEITPSDNTRRYHAKKGR